ncbi:papain-like cysteine peptidase [Paenibacillus sp. SC116]|uniref:papain-like cysteine peptidase n=1 Tax=Paenibacillus sp. SC116 TaxID=2968986 RepID=UPI00215B2FE2|nr:papain-like cysteine peptidase [Paenibacillus sp. SC116]
MRDLSSYNRVVIGLGGSCSVAYQIRRLGLRQASYPLDWFGMPDASLTASLIQSNFSSFMERDNLDILGITDNGLYYHVVDRKWDCHSFHDFPVVEGEPPLYNYELYYQTLQKRIHRFSDDLRKDKPVILIRMGYIQRDIPLLEEAISVIRQYPFDLLLINESHACKQPELIAKHKSTLQYLMPNGPSWYGNDDAWVKLACEVLKIEESGSKLGLE